MRLTTTALLLAALLAAQIGGCSVNDEDESGSVDEQCLYPSDDAGADADLDATAGDAGSPACPTPEEAATQLTNWCMDHPTEIVAGPMIRDGACCYTARWPACTDVDTSSSSCAVARPGGGGCASLPLAAIVLLAASLLRHENRRASRRE